MKIKTKLITGTLALVVTSILIVGFTANYITQKKHSIPLTLLQNLRSQVQLLAEEYNTDSANYFFSNSYDELTTANAFKDSMKERVVEYYETNFQKPFDKLNTSKSIPKEEYFKDFSKNSWLLQYHYMASSPHSVEEKYKLIRPDAETSPYASGHGGYHKVFLKYAQLHGYRDIYLISADGRVNYSLNKGFELGTSVLDGPFSNTGLGRAFRAALEGNKSDIIIENFSSYAPLYGVPAAFMASPLVKFKRVRGVFVVQLPIDVIDKIMTNDKQWKKVGLGNSGETYLVGPDKTLRNTSRLKYENPDLYFEKIEKFSKTNPQPIDNIITSGTNI